MFRWFLSTILFLCSFVSATTIEYGGISFDCDSECGVPKYDYQAEKISHLLHQVIEDINDHAELCNQDGKLRTIIPYHFDDNNGDYNFIELHRYDWERANGKYIEDESSHSDPPSSQYEYESCANFEFTHSSLSRLIDLPRQDIAFFLQQREAHYERRLEIRTKRLNRILDYRKQGYTAVEYTEDRKRLVQGISVVPGEEFDVPEGFCWQWTSDARDYEEQAIQDIQKKLKQPSLLWTQEHAEEAFQKIEVLIKEIFIWCLNNHQPEGIAFNTAIASFLTQDLPEALEAIRSLIEIMETNQFGPEIISKLHLLKGELQSEFCLHADAIVSLTEAISKNPHLKEAYLERAASYFELGNFDRALEDYLAQKAFAPTLKDKSEFALGFMSGGTLGSLDAIAEFIPNTLSSLHGLGHFLWTAIQHPIEAPRQAICSVLEICALLRDCSAFGLTALAVPELGDLVTIWDEIEDFERGQKIGHILGKYGTEMLTPLALKKGTVFFSHLTDLKKAEKLGTLETLGDSAKKEEMLGAAKKWADGRNEKISKIKIEVGKQNKHDETVKTFQRFDDKGRQISILTHPNPQELLDNFSGKGRKANAVVGGPGTPDYREKVNFGFVIGKTEDKDRKMVETTWGMIHYSKKGAHIVPRLPDLQ